MAADTALADKLSTKILFGSVIFSSLILFFFLPVFIFCLLAFSPSFVAAVTDQENELYLSKSVFMCNFCGVLPIVLKLVTQSMTLPQVFDLMQDPIIWLIVLGATGFGWLIYLFVPKIVTSILRSKASARMQKLETAKQALFHVWGEDAFKTIQDNNGELESEENFQAA